MNKIWIFGRRSLGASLLAVAAVVALGGAAAALSLLAPLTNSVATVSLVVLATILALASLFGAAAFHIAGSGTHHRHGHRFGLVLTTIVALAGALLLFKPLDVPAMPQAARADTRYWDLPTGSRLAYMHYAAVGRPRAEPIVYLHGGPGAPLRETEYRFFERFAHDGYEVYLYEQAGVGHSHALADAADYTVQRNVNDLEAIRQASGAQRLILVGQSWGAALAAHYTARHPQRVAKLILASPGPMRHADWVRLDVSRSAAAAAPMPPLRVIAATELAKMNPELAANYAPPHEMNDYMDSVAQRLQRQSYCAGQANVIPQVDATGFNFYANRVALQDMSQQADPHAALRASGVPALIVKGECDYVPWSVAYDYKSALPEACMVYLPRTGHLLWGGQPELTFAVMQAFLDDLPLPARALPL